MAGGWVASVRESAMTPSGSPMKMNQDRQSGEQQLLHDRSTS